MENQKTRSPQRMLGLMIGGIIALLVIAITAINSFTIVGVGKEKVGAFFGTVYETPLKSGLHIVNPLADFEIYDLQEVVMTWDDMGVPAQDNLKTTMDVAVTGHFLAGKTPWIREKIGSSEGFMNSQVWHRIPAMVVEVGKELSKESQNFYGKTTLAQMEVEIVDRLNKELHPKGYNITIVKFSDIDLPQVVTESVIETKKRQQEVNQQAAKLEIADLKAQEKTKVAQANAESAVHNATAVREAADAELYRIQKVAEGNIELSKSVTPELIQLKEVEAKLKWNGQMPTTMLGESANILMQMK